MKKENDFKMRYTKEQIAFYEDLHKRWRFLSFGERAEHLFEMNDYLWYIMPEEEKRKHIKEREEQMELDKDNPFVLRRIKK